MGTVDNAALARLCRTQAGLASNAETRATLLELARIYDGRGDAADPVNRCRTGRSAGQAGRVTWR